MEPRLTSPPLDQTPVPTPLHSPLLPPVVYTSALGPEEPNYVLHRVRNNEKSDASTDSAELGMSLGCRLESENPATHDYNLFNQVPIPPATNYDAFFSSVSAAGTKRRQSLENELLTSASSSTPAKSSSGVPKSPMSTSSSNFTSTEKKPRRGSLERKLLSPVQEEITPGSVIEVALPHVHSPIPRSLPSIDLATITLKADLVSKKTPSPLLPAQLGLLELGLSKRPEGSSGSTETLLSPCMKNTPRQTRVVDENTPSTPETPNVAEESPLSPLSNKYLEESQVQKLGLESSEMLFLGSPVLTGKAGLAKGRSSSFGVASQSWGTYENNNENSNIFKDNDEAFKRYSDSLIVECIDEKFGADPSDEKIDKNQPCEPLP